MNRAGRVVLAVMVLVAAWGLSAHAAPAPTEDSGPPPINWFEFGKDAPPFIAMIVNFGILAAGYYLFGRKPIAAALQNRRDSIAREIEEAQKIKGEAEARAKMYQAKLEMLEADVRAAREALLRAGEAERDRIVAEAEAKAERIRNDAEFVATQEFKQIRQDLWREALESATRVAEELLKKRVTHADQERLAEDYLAELSGKKAERVGTAEEVPRRGSLGSGPGNAS